MTNELKATTLGDPACPICNGIGFVRRDLSIDDPQFGHLEVCDCRKKMLANEKFQRLYELSNVESFKGMTFATFNIHGRSGKKSKDNTLEVAFNTAKNYGEHLSGWLLLMGSFGSGKTHLAAAVANHAIANGKATIFLTVPDLLDWLRYTFQKSGSSYEERFEEIRNIDFLILDDLGTQNTTSWAREKLYQIINHRYVNRLPTLITTNLSMREIDDRISSRLQDRDLVTKVIISAPDYRNPLYESGSSPISQLAYLSDHRTFDKFSARKNEKLSADNQNNLDNAFKAAQMFAEDPKGWLVLMGTFGTGKTHLAAAIGNYRAALGDNPIFSVVPDLLDHLRATFNPNSNVSYDHIFNQVREARLLILDDLSTQSATPWAREKLHQILNFRYERKLATVITTSSELKEIDARIRTRLQDGRLTKIQGLLVPPYHEKRKRSR